MPLVLGTFPLRSMAQPLVIVPPVPAVTPVNFSYNDTSGTDSFSPSTGAILATQSPLSFGIVGGTGTTTVTKLGVFGNLSVVAATGTYTYTPDDAAINAVESGAPTDMFIITATNINGMGQGLLTVTVNGAAEASGYVASLAFNDARNSQYL